MISVECSGQVIYGDLLASGQIRQRGQTFTTPGNFLRSTCLYHGAPAPTGDSWRIVYYKGIPLSLLRDATLSEENALAAIAAQSSMEHWVAEPRRPPSSSGEPSLPKCIPWPVHGAGARGINKGQRSPRKREREMSTPSERGVNLDARGREVEATHEGVMKNARCDCGSVGEWRCGESSGESSSSSSEPKVFEVEAILEKRLAHGRVEYLVRWEGFDSSADSWQPRANLRSEQLKAFECEWASRTFQSQPAVSTCSPPPAASTDTLLSASTSSSMAAGSSTSLPDLNADQAEGHEALEYNRCSCRAPCSLLPLIERELLTPGEGVLSVCCKGVLTFADLDAQGSIISVGRGGQKITYRFPCAFVRVARQRAGCAPLSDRRSLNIYSHLTYKGVRLDMVRPQPCRQSKR